MEQLIKITTIPIEYEFKISNAKFERRSSTAELEISRNEGGGMQIKSRPIRLNLDTYEARNSVVPTTKTAIYQAAQKGQNAAYEATAQFASEGKMLLRAKVGSEALSNLFEQRAEQPKGDFKMGFIPTTGPNIEWEPPEISIQYEMDKLNFDTKVANGNIQFVPGSIELVINQLPDVQIDYIGDPIYVPPSAAEMFNPGSIVDEKA